MEKEVILASLSILAALLVTSTAIMQLVSPDWRFSLLMLALQYLGVFLLLINHWPIFLSLTVLFSGWVSTIVLAIGILSLSVDQQRLESGATTLSLLVRQGAWRHSLSIIFFLLTALLGGIVTLTMLPALTAIFPSLNLSIGWGSLILIGLGFLKLGYSDQSFPVVVGLLTVISGFNVLQTSFSSSLMTAGLLAATTLTLALIGDFLITMPYSETTP